MPKKPKRNKHHFKMIFEIELTEQELKNFNEIGDQLLREYKLKNPGTTKSFVGNSKVVEQIVRDYLKG